MALPSTESQAYKRHPRHKISPPLSLTWDTKWSQHSLKVPESAQIPEFCRIQAKPKIYTFLEKVATINFQPTNFLFVAVAKVRFKTLSSKNHNKNNMTHTASMNFGTKSEIRARILKVCKDRKTCYPTFFSFPCMLWKFSNSALQVELVMSTVNLNTSLHSSVLRKAKA